jgi:hypothetical protein
MSLQTGAPRRGFRTKVEKIWEKIQIIFHFSGEGLLWNFYKDSQNYWVMKLWGIGSFFAFKYNRRVAKM